MTVHFYGADIYFISIGGIRILVSGILFCDVTDFMGNPLCVQPFFSLLSRLRERIDKLGSSNIFSGL